MGSVLITVEKFFGGYKKVTATGTHRVHPDIARFWDFVITGNSEINLPVITGGTPTVDETVPWGMPILYILNSTSNSSTLAVLTGDDGPLVTLTQGQISVIALRSSNPANTTAAWSNQVFAIH